MRIPTEFTDVRLNLVRTAELAVMHPAHLRRLIRRGVLPPPKRTARGMPFFDYLLLLEIANVLKTGIGKNGEEVAFYQRRNRPRRPRPSRARATGNPAASVQPPASASAYQAALVEGLRQLGLSESQLAPQQAAAALTAEFGANPPPLAQALPAVARRLLATEGN